MDGVPTIYVVARYEGGQSYGGAEEGGWWFWDGELACVVLSTRNEDRAWDAVRRLNEVRKDWRGRTGGGDSVRYEVVELPRREVKTHIAEQLCHADYELDDNDYEVRWDIPQYLPEARPHYC